MSIYCKVFNLRLSLEFIIFYLNIIIPIFMILLEHFLRGSKICVAGTRTGACFWMFFSQNMNRFWPERAQNGEHEKNIFFRHFQFEKISH